MKPGVSSLNPYAASYVPLSKREAYSRTEHTAKDSKSGNESVWYGHPLNVTQNQHRSNVSLDAVGQGAERYSIPEASSVKNHPVHGFYGSSSSKRTADEEFDMDMEYLQMSFPGLSDQSINDVYLANNGDLEATIDMLTQLEFDTMESSEILPDTLDIGDVSEPGASSECASLKLKNVVPEVSASSSASADPGIVS
ncbi:hypothetical protein Dsin_017494 [Dipteronia sinensis]|uniref:CUE domain-containing protein n=1 Tax=Dipteronia sinensis TaxID=43782 RepID=A0AAE0AG24_9ROSI|nr:hypothetical protein Dsin_017494 [Dipteronia sinensis]